MYINTEESHVSFTGYAIRYFKWEIPKEIDNLTEENCHIKMNTKVYPSSDFSECTVELEIIITDSVNYDFLKCNIQGFFSRDEIISQEIFMKMTENDFVAVLYPIIRATILTFTSLTNITPINLPLILV